MNELQNPTKILLKIQVVSGILSYVQMVVVVGNDGVVGGSVVMRSSSEKSPSPPVIDIMRSSSTI